MENKVSKKKSQKSKNEPRTQRVRENREKEQKKSSKSTEPRRLKRSEDNPREEEPRANSMPRNTSSKITYESIDMSKSIYAIIKEINPNSRINKSTMEFLNNMVKDFAIRIMNQADDLRRDMSTRKFVSGKDIETAIKLISRNPIAANMISEGKKLADLVKSKESKQRQLTQAKS